ncbi:DUF559 domain-containing protein [Candidatus Micrarchaeota archaeon]|nr:DUF559 domain-containing protein [Candidatus Micrarchaeota archaeon]
MAFPDVKLAIFCDGDYWHRRPDVHEKDQRVNRILKENGWTVLRFWETEIRRDSKRIVNEIEHVLKEARNTWVLVPENGKAPSRLRGQELQKGGEDALEVGQEKTTPLKAQAETPCRRIVSESVNTCFRV